MAPYEPPANAHYTELDVSQYPEDFIWFCVGHKGKNFYDITSWLGIQYLWYDNSRKVIEIWGSWNSLNDNQAKSKIDNVIKMYNEIY